MKNQETINATTGDFASHASLLESCPTVTDDRVRRSTPSTLPFGGWEPAETRGEAHDFLPCTSTQQSSECSLIQKHFSCQVSNPN